MAATPTKKWKGEWKEEEMVAATAEYLSPLRPKSTSMRSIAARHGLDHTTLGRRVAVEKKNTTPSPYKSPHTPGPPRKLTDTQEQAIIDGIKSAQEGGYRTGAVTKNTVRRLATDIAAAADNSFATTPSNNFIAGLLRRHPEVKAGKVNHLSLIRAKVTQESLTEWESRYAEQLSSLFGRHAHSSASTALRIWNADETGFSNLDHGAKRTLMVVGAHNPTKNIVSVRLADHLSVMACINAAGHAMPPFCISTGKQVQALWSIGAPCGTSMAVSPNGSMTQQLFPKFIQHFIDNLPSGYDTTKPTLLLLDNHNSRSSSEAINLAKAHNITLFGLLANATHFLQPCDRFVLTHYKRHFHNAAYAYINEHKSASVPKSAYGHLLHMAQAALTPAVIKRSWLDSGLYPPNTPLLQSHPSVLHTAPSRAASAPAAAGRIIPPLAAAGVAVVSRNGQVQTSGQDLTAPHMLVAILAQEAKKQLREATKQRAADKKTLARAGTLLEEPEAKRSKAAAKLLSTLRSTDDKENVPPPPLPPQPSPHRTRYANGYVAETSFSLVPFVPCVAAALAVAPIPAIIPQSL